LSGSPPWAIKAVLAEAINRGQWVSLRYRPYIGAGEGWVVIPTSVTKRRNTEFLVAFGRDGERLDFTLDRIVSVVREANE
jgi:predicted DNA-binding transcriptional regulator YafY